MADIIVWTTAELDFVLRDEQGEVPSGIFDGLQDAIVTISQSGARIEKRLAEIGVEPETGTIHVVLTQQDTGRLQGGTRQAPKAADAQVNLYYQDSTRNATYEVRLNVLRNLHPQRMP